MRSTVDTKQQNGPGESFIPRAEFLRESFSTQISDNGWRIHPLTKRPIDPEKVVVLRGGRGPLACVCGRSDNSRYFVTDILKLAAARVLPVVALLIVPMAILLIRLLDGLSPWPIVPLVLGILWAGVFLPLYFTRRFVPEVEAWYVSQGHQGKCAKRRAKIETFSFYRSKGFMSYSQILRSPGESVYAPTLERDPFPGLKAVAKQFVGLFFVILIIMMAVFGLSMGIAYVLMNNHVPFMRL